MTAPEPGRLDSFLYRSTVVARRQCLTRATGRCMPSWPSPR